MTGAYFTSILMTFRKPWPISIRTWLATAQHDQVHDVLSPLRNKTDVPKCSRCHEPLQLIRTPRPLSRFANTPQGPISDLGGRWLDSFGYELASQRAESPSHRAYTALESSLPALFS